MSVTLYEARTAAGYTRESLSALTGVGVRTIYDIENDLTVPRRSTRTLLALALKRHQIDWPTETMEKAAA